MRRHKQKSRDYVGRSRLEINIASPSPWRTWIGREGRSSKTNL
jgi:hypothetical protein